jgi:diaminopimelate epimerase
MPHAHTLALTKHHGLGNDFLVLLDTDDRYAGEAHAAMAVALCDRRTGIGADGLLRLGPGLRMHLHNADGSRAEMSGNGIRCLAQAVFDQGVHGGPDVELQTDAGPKWVRTNFDGTYTVDMGTVTVKELSEGRAEVDTGNPHLVLVVDDPAAVDLEALGQDHLDVNLEIIRVDDQSNVTMRVHERGAGITQACGTGSCAIAGATRAWGLTGDKVTIHNPGGDLGVELQGDTAFLTGPATYIGRVEVSDTWH